VNHQEFQNRRSVVDNVTRSARRLRETNRSKRLALKVLTIRQSRGTGNRVFEITNGSRALSTQRMSRLTQHVLRTVVRRANPIRKIAAGAVAGIEGEEAGKLQRVPLPRPVLLLMK
jgi:hypothetical protein